MSITGGNYIIRPVIDEEKALAIGPVPLIYPPPTVPLRILSGFNQPFTVKPAEDGTFTLVDNPRANGYGIAQGREDGVFAVFSQEGQHSPWSVVSGGGSGKYRIKLPNEDKYWTVNNNEDDYVDIKLQSANGSPEQEWVFTRAED